VDSKVLFAQIAEAKAILVGEAVMTKISNATDVVNFGMESHVQNVAHQ